MDVGTRIECIYGRPCLYPSCSADSPLAPVSFAQISDSLKHFGLSPSTRHLLLVHIAPLAAGERAASDQRKEADEVLKRMEAIVDGEVLLLEDLGRLPDGGTDEKAIRKVSALALGSLLRMLRFPSQHDG